MFTSMFAQGGIISKRVTQSVFSIAAILQTSFEMSVRERPTLIPAFRSPNLFLQPQWPSVLTYRSVFKICLESPDLDRTVHVPVTLTAFSGLFI